MNIPSLLPHYLPFSIEAYKKFHAHPEGSMREYETSKRIANYLHSMNLSYTFLPDKRGLIAKIQGNRNISIAYRCEIDALKIKNSSFSPKNGSYQHVCGHDANIAMMLTCIKILQDHPQLTKPTIYCIFQPEEESATGAKKCMSVGDYFSKIDSIFALHLSPDLAEGEFFIPKGPLLYGAQTYLLTIKLLDKKQEEVFLKEISVFFETLSQEEGLLANIHKVHTAKKQLHMVITLKYKTLSHLKNADFLLKHFLNKGKIEAQLFSKTICPPVHNDPFLCHLALSTIHNTFSQKSHSPIQPLSGGDDFGFYLEEKKGLYVFLGSRNEEKKFIYPLHHPRFDFDKTLLAKGYGFSLQYILSYKK